MKNIEIIPKLIKEAIEKGVNEIAVEYKDGFDEIFIIKSNLLIGIKSYKSDSETALNLREELYFLRNRKTLKIDNTKYSIKIIIFNSFGEDAFRLLFERIKN